MAELPSIRYRSPDEFSDRSTNSEGPSNKCWTDQCALDAWNSPAPIGRPSDKQTNVGDASELQPFTKMPNKPFPETGYRLAGGERDNVFFSAQSALGRQQWKRYGRTGELGAAASVSAVLNGAGYKYADQVSVRGLQEQLQSHGWTTTESPQPGDVIVAYGANEGMRAHCGIVGIDARTFSNHSTTGQWSQEQMSEWNAGKYPGGVYFLQPPDLSNTGEMFIASRSGRETSHLQIPDPSRLYMRG